MFIGIDVGTSAVKAVLLDGEQRALAEGEAPIVTSNPQPLWSEQDPLQWWTATRTALDALRSSAPRAWPSVAAIGLSGQMHGAVCLDAADQPLRPAILWNDGRATNECEQMAAAVPQLGEVAGVIAMPGFTAPKLLWLRQHEPRSFERIRCVLLPKDFVRLKLTGELATDMSDAAGTLWLDQAGRKWSEESCL